LLQQEGKRFVFGEKGKPGGKEGWQQKKNERKNLDLHVRESGRVPGRRSRKEACTDDSADEEVAIIALLLGKGKSI